MGRGEPGIGPSLTTQLLYFRQELEIRQRGARPERSKLTPQTPQSQYGQTLARRPDLCCVQQTL